MSISLLLVTSVQEYLRAIQDIFKFTDKSLVSTLMKKLIMTRYDDTQRIQDHILNIADKTMKLKALSMNVYQYFLMWFILSYLPPLFGLFKFCYNTNKDN